MKKTRIKKRICAAFAMVLGVICVATLCACSSTDPYAYEIDTAFSITRLSIEIDVDENRKTHVTEEFTVLFNATRRGIIRDLPTNSGEVYQDISLEGDDYFVTATQNFVRVNTGSKYDTGYKSPGTFMTYRLKYTIIPPSNTFNTENFYMNIVPQGYPTTVENVAVTVNFPYDITDYVLYCGMWGDNVSVEDSPFTVVQNGAQIIVTADRLSAYYGASLDAKLTKNLGGYINPRTVVAIVIAVIVAVLAIVLKFFTKTKQVVEVVNFYPPEVDGKRLNPAQLGMLIDNSVEPSDITALIFYWASRGYILIENAEKGAKNAKADPFEQDFEQTEPQKPVKDEKLKELVLVKLKDLQGEPYEIKLFNKIFASGNRVNIKKLENKLYQQIQSCQNAVKQQFSGKLYDKKRLVLSIAIGLTGAAITAIAGLLFGISIHGGFVFFNGGFALLPAVIPHFFGTIALHKKHKLQKQQKVMLIAAQMASAVIFAGVAAFLIGGAMPLFARISLCLLSGICGAISPFFNDYTDYYADILGHILGFKNFLFAAEKSRLEMLLEENPQYYYDVLPYANVLGVSEIWQDKFKKLAVEPPSYYHSQVSVFDIVVFNALYRNMFRRINTVSVSRPANASKSGGFGGGGFGGGFSGGGFGGGGMGSR